MSKTGPGPHAVRIAALLVVLLTGGCAELERASPDDPPGTGAVGIAVPDPWVPPAASTQEPFEQPGGAQDGTVAFAPATPPTPEPLPARSEGGAVALEPIVPPAARSETRPTAQPPAKAESTVAKTPAKVLAAATPAAATGQLLKKESIAAGPAKEATPPLDVAGLSARLRDTKAIGVFTKLALKNQMDDLLKQFRAQHESGQKTGIASLRQPYDMLVLKVLSVVQDGDPSLARTIAGSREAIWSLLADAEKFRSVT